jgi:hypothetical protein
MQWRMQVTSANDFEVMARTSAGSSMRAILEALNGGPLEVGAHVMNVVAPDMQAAAELNVRGISRQLCKCVARNVHSVDRLTALLSVVIAQVLSAGDLRWLR